MIALSDSPILRGLQSSALFSIGGQTRAGRLDRLDPRLLIPVIPMLRKRCAPHFLKLASRGLFRLLHIVRAQVVGLRKAVALGKQILRPSVVLIGPRDRFACQSMLWMLDSARRRLGARTSREVQRVARAEIVEKSGLVTRKSDQLRAAGIHRLSLGSGRPLLPPRAFQIRARHCPS